MVRALLLLLVLVLLVSAQLQVPFLKPNLGTFKEEDDGVCLFLSTVLRTRAWSPLYTRKFIHWMHRVFLVSVKRQFKTLCPSVRVFKLLINGHRNDPKLAELYNYGKHRGEIPIVWHFTKQWPAIVKETVLTHNCKYISSLWLDGDDALLDGYFKYISEEIPKMLTETITSEGRPWLGAVFALRSPKWLELGLNKCRGIFEGPELYCGYSQGQGLILKRSVWNALDQEMYYHGFHGSFVKNIREWVMHGLGHLDYVSMAGKGPLRFWHDTEEMRALEQSDAAKSQIQMIDLSRNWTTSGLFIKTPFSSHFRWKFIDMMPECTKEHIIEIMRDFPQDIEYIIKAWMENPEIHVTMMEACSNNIYMLEALGNKTCEEVEAQWLKKHSYPKSRIS